MGTSTDILNSRTDMENSAELLWRIQDMIICYVDYMAVYGGFYMNINEQKWSYHTKFIPQLDRVFRNTELLITLAWSINKQPAASI